MNDNLPNCAPRSRNRTGRHEAWLQQVQAVRNIGIRALARPESLSMGEIQDIAWGFLMAARALDRMPSSPSTASDKGHRPAPVR